MNRTNLGNSNKFVTFGFFFFFLSYVSCALGSSHITVSDIAVFLRDLILFQRR